MNDMLADLQEGIPLQCVMYGDGAYPAMSHLICRHYAAVGSILPAVKQKENRDMSRVRIVNEWAYGVTAQLYPFVKFRYKLQVTQKNLVNTWYMVANFLRKCLQCLRGGLAPGTFNCMPPTIEEYLL